MSELREKLLKKAMRRHNDISTQLQRAPHRLWKFKYALFDPQIKGDHEETCNWVINSTLSFGSSYFQEFIQELVKVYKEEFNG